MKSVSIIKNEADAGINTKYKLTGLLFLFSIFIASIIVTNIIGVKVMTLFGFNFTAGIITYGVVFLMTDVISEVWGRSVAYYAVVLGFVGSLFSLLFVHLAVISPAATYWGGQEAYAQTLGGVWIIIVASMAAYLIAQINDVFLFHRLRQATNGKHLWLRNNVSTAISQTIDTVVFVTVAFGPYGFGLPWDEIFTIIVGQIVIKYVIAIIDTPIAYVLVHFFGGPVEGAHEQRRN